MKRVLLTSAGGRLALGVTRALKAAPEPLHLIGVDSNKFMLQRAETDENYLVPRANDSDYIPCLRSIIDETGTDFLFVGLASWLLLSWGDDLRADRRCVLAVRCVRGRRRSRCLARVPAAQAGGGAGADDERGSVRGGGRRTDAAGTVASRVAS